MDKFGKSVKTNVFLGYLSLVLIAAITVWAMYSEMIKLTENRVDIQPVNTKIFLVNSVLTNLYQAEGFERTYLQTKNRKHYQAYIQLMDSVQQQIDSLGIIASSRSQYLHADSIQLLLAKKRENFKELVALKNAGTAEELYQKSMLRLAADRDSIYQIPSISKTVTISKDSILIKKKKKRFFERIANVFSPQEKADSTLKVVVTQTTQIDSILDVFNPADSVAEFLSLVMEDIKNESIVLKNKLIRKEQEILENDKVIMLKIRQMFIRFENEVINTSLQQVERQQGAIRNMTWLVILLGAFALLVIVGFLFLILKDITRSQLYRQHLEKEKAYSETLLKNKEQLMLSITHDLKSPLSSIIGYSHLIGREDMAPVPRRYLENIDQSASYILRLINDLVDFVRLETGRLKIENTRFNLKILLKEVVDGFYPLAEKKNVELHLHEKLPSDDTFFSDPVRIKQILGNLVSNAIKFTDSGRVEVMCALHKTKDAKVWIEFTVKDTGIGISSENTKIIFDEFARVSSQDGRQYEGTGLGLTITKRMVELLGGEILLESRYGKGSRFTVRLPLQRPSETAKSSKPAIKKIHTGAPMDTLCDRQVLLVDDDAVLLDMTTAVLQTNKLKVTALTDPREAMTAACNNSFDLLITDIQMPRMNGFELLTFFKKHNRNAKAIAVSGKAANAADFENAGFSAFIEKPFLPEVLVKVVGAVLKGERVTPENCDVDYKGDSDYSLETIKAFASDDPETMRDILVSFIETTAQNVELFRMHLRNQDIKALSQLAHKMLPLYRQLKVDKVVKPLVRLEQHPFDEEHKSEWQQTGEAALKNVITLLEKISNDHQLPLPDALIL